MASVLNRRYTYVRLSLEQVDSRGDEVPQQSPVRAEGSAGERSYQKDIPAEGTTAPFAERHSSDQVCSPAATLCIFKVQTINMASKPC